MKKFLSALVALMATTVGISAQGLTATLQQDGKSYTFSGVNAFQSAYSVAEDGDIITLSAGTFNTVETIAKSITIIGNGYEGDRTTIDYYNNSEKKWYENFKITANNVRLEGLDLLTVNVCPDKGSVISGLHISRCYLGRLYANGAHRNTVVEQSLLAYDHAIKLSENYCLMNSYIWEFEEGNTKTNLAYIANCFIPRWYYLNRETNDSSTDHYYYRSAPYAIYKNCILGYFNYYYTYVENDNFWKKYSIYNYLSSPSEYYNNVFFLYPFKYDGSNFVENDNTKELKAKEIKLGVSGVVAQDNVGVAYNDLFDIYAAWYEPKYVKTTVKGDDGKPVGLFGGIGFALMPDIPRIVESKIDSNTDADGRLNVKVKIETNK